jgi:hypothetical protein
MSGLRVRVQVPADHIVKLPDEVPIGPVEFILVTPVAQHDAKLRLAIAKELIRTSPPQRTDSTELIREDRMR